MLGEALRNIDGDAPGRPPWRRRTILRGFATLSPRSESPPNRLTAEGIFDEIRECKVSPREHCSGPGVGTPEVAGTAGSSGDRPNPGNDTAMPMDETEPVAAGEVDGDETMKIQCMDRKHWTRAI